MDKLITITPAAEITKDYKEQAVTWPKWDSKSRKSFPYKYTSQERTLILAGSAVLTPTDGSCDKGLVIEEGNAVIFHKGFACKWKITKRMKKHYAVFNDENEEDVLEAAITCDVCTKDCFAESYFVNNGEDELDLCVACYKKDKKKYAGKDVEHQKEGEAFVEKVKPSKKRKK